MKLMIGADLVPTDTNSELFEMGDVDSLIGNELIELLNSVDYCCFNLEVPLTDKKTPINKCGPSLQASTKSINTIRLINPFFFTLANNHIMDQGECGLKSTIEVLTDSGIAFAGAGYNLQQASKPHIVNIDGKTVGFYCCAEHEFSIASHDQPGANPFDPLESLDHIVALKEKCDYLIVLYHGGKEHYRYPSPKLQKTCRKIVEKGANLVVCQHSHCIGCKEEWENGTIVYGQGNFLFDHSQSEFWKTSILIEVDIDDLPKIKYHALVKDDNKVRLADPESAKQIMHGFNTRSAEITNQAFVYDNYMNFAKDMYYSYMYRVLGKKARSPIFKVLNKITNGLYLKKYVIRNYELDEKYALLNVLECEAHSELFSIGLRM